MAETMSGFFRCNKCDRLHTTGGLTVISTCACGKRLLPQVFPDTGEAPAYTIPEGL